jgi:phenylpropionate dioxygenase-like ring-hydroxylating dioxygenase large terminal subunit
MEHTQQLELIDKLLLHLERGTTASADVIRGAEISVYSNGDLLALEKQKFFREWPLVAAMTADIPNAGDFLTQDILGSPVLLIRGHDGIARSFLNVCRHRGARVESEPCGSRKMFSCPFHAWGYNTRGELVGLPHRETFGNLDISGLGLTSLPTIERYGLIWLRLDPNASTIDIDAYLGGLAPELEAWNISEAAVVGRDRFESKMNWKLAIDTFGETYHFEVLHKRTVNQGFFSNVQLYDTFERNHRMVFAGRGLRDLANQPRQEWQLRPNSLLAYYLFPNTQLLIQRGGISLFRIFPLGDDPHTCVTELTFYA